MFNPKEFWGTHPCLQVTTGPRAECDQDVLCGLRGDPGPTGKDDVMTGSPPSVLFTVGHPGLGIVPGIH